MARTITVHRVCVTGHSRRVIAAMRPVLIASQLCDNVNNVPRFSDGRVLDKGEGGVVVKVGG